MIDDSHMVSYDIAELPPILQKWAQMEDTVIEVTTENAAEAAAQISKTGKYFNRYLSGLLDYAVNIRRFNWEAYGLLYAALQKLDIKLIVLNREFNQYLQKIEVIPLARDKKKQPKRSLFYYQNEFSENSIEYAVKCDDLEKIVAMTESKQDFSKIYKWRGHNHTLIDLAAFLGSPNVFKYLFLKGGNTTPNTFVYALEGGNIEILDFLVQNNFVITKDAIVPAIQNHRMNVARWVVENSTLIPNSECIEWSMLNYCTLNFYNDLVRFQTGKCDELTKGILDTAINIGNGGAILTILCSSKTTERPSAEQLQKILEYAKECEDTAIIERLKAFGVE